MTRERATATSDTSDPLGAADLVERIRRAAGTFSASFRRVADYAVAHLYDVAFYPAARVAEQADVSESVVVRFATSLGYAGYPEMQRTAQMFVRAQSAPSARLESLPITSASTLPEILRAVLTQDANNLRDTTEDPANHDFGTVVEAILGARRVFVAGFRGLGHLAGLLAFLLDMSGIEATVIGSGDAVGFQQARHMGRGDLFIAFSFVRYTRRTVDLVRLARDRGVRTVVIADSITSPASREADHVLRAAVATQSFHNSYVAAASIINAIVTAISTKARDRVAQSLKEVDAILPLDEFDLT